MKASWKHPYAAIIEAERQERDYIAGYQDGDYNLRYQTCVISGDSSSYRRGFEKASGYTPEQWKNL